MNKTHVLHAEFRLVTRPSYAEDEWVLELNVKDGSQQDKWTLCSWPKKPNAQCLENAISSAKQAMRFAYRQVPQTVPRFEVVEGDTNE